MNLGGIRPPESPLASWFGKVLVARPGENWPLTAKGQPMQPLCQINLEELPFKPNALRDIAFLSLLLDPDGFDPKLPNGSSWLLRAYKTLDGLTAMAVPNMKSHVKPFPLVPEVIETDYPCHDNVSAEISQWFDDQGLEHYDHLRTADGLKLGGWPALIQSELVWEYNSLPSQPAFVFQVNSESKAEWSWGDAGYGYFGRGTAPGQEDEWSFDWQCY